MANPKRRDASAALLRQIGEAMVAWSQIEDIWASIFQVLLFDDMQERTTPGVFRTDDEPYEPRERALSIWDSVQSSKAQLDMTEALARVVLRRRPKDLAPLRTALNATNKLRGKRNALAHAPFQRENEFPMMGEVWKGPGKLQLTERAKHHLRDKDPYTEAPLMLQEFAVLKHQVSGVFARLLLGDDPFDGLPPADGKH